MIQGTLTIKAEINDLLWLREHMHDLRRSNEYKTRKALSADKHDEAQTVIERLNALISGMTIS